MTSGQFAKVCTLAVAFALACVFVSRLQAQAPAHYEATLESPEADGTIPAVQMSRLKALGSWLKLNGGAIYATSHGSVLTVKPGTAPRCAFTQNDSSVYAILLGKPKANTVTIKSLSPKPGPKILLMGTEGALSWSQQGNVASVIWVFLIFKGFRGGWLDRSGASSLAVV